MLSCKDVAQRASLLVDGELGPLQRLNMRLHLAMCRGCRSFVRQIRITRDVVGAASRQPAQDADAAAIEAILSRMRSPP